MHYDKPTKTFFITGGAGFIGSHLCEALLHLGYRVLALDNLSTGRMANINHLLDHPLFHFARAEITDAIVMDRLASEADVIIHLAAAVGVKLIVEKPVQTIETNVMGTEYVLKAALRYGCRTLVASTSEVYGKGSRIPFSEEDDVLLGATNKSRWSYAASKMVDEFLSLAYHQQFGLETILLRFFNTVGPRQVGHYGMVIPRFVGQALDDKPLEVFGDGQQSRCFCDVRDVVQAIIRLALHPTAHGRVYNIGGTEEITILQLAERVKVLTGSNSPIVQIPYDQAYAPGFEDMRRRVPSLRRIEEWVDWRPHRSLDDILTSVIAFMREEREKS
ncbi:MAG: GDP-mannose 4,6-dehydratase [Chloroflexi bacterium]|nr:GDP-mannose 4,6-dehydratase [Chloroflexota bacterium]MBP8054515.1 GDP-mannose 4,6-dehydratase [Chloroflexota bacterium]